MIDIEKIILSQIMPDRDDPRILELEKIVFDLFGKEMSTRFEGDLVGGFAAAGAIIYQTILLYREFVIFVAQNVGLSREVAIERANTLMLKMVDAKHPDATTKTDKGASPSHH